jgi:hypothetical protein
MEINIDEFEFIKGYEQYYMINKDGKIYSLHYKKIMSNVKPEKENYYYVHLVKDKQRKKCYIHRLLGMQYIDNPNNYPEIDHIDRNTINNNLSNLRWVTRIENIHNKANHKSQLTTEQLEARKDRTRERARLWAEKNRREKGITPKTDMTKTKDPNYKKNKAEEYKNKLTVEEKEAKLERRRQYYKDKEINAKQKEYINNPEVKERRRLQQIARRKALKELENKDI